jgi:hypothetical protein
MDAVLTAVTDAALNHRRRDLGVPGRRHVAQRLRACSAAYMALGASLLIAAAGDHDQDQILVGFLLWMAGTVLLLLSFVSTRFPEVAAVAAGVARSTLEELAMATVLALAQHDFGRQPL